MRRSILVACAVVFWSAGARAQPAGELAHILTALAARTQQYYDRFVSIICTETVHQQEMRRNLAPLGRPRVTVYELSVALDPAGRGEDRFRVERTLLSVNGRPARRNQRPGCTDPKTGSPEPLGFLLAENQARYRFSISENPVEGPPGTRAVDFVESPPAGVRVTWEGSCFQAEGGGHRGRVWYDPVTYDVLQVEIRLAKPFPISTPSGFYGQQSAIRVERSEMTIRFSRVEFRQPDEVVLLPETIETLHVLQGAPSLRLTQTLGNFRRFLTKSEIRSGAF